MIDERLLSLLHRAVTTLQVEGIDPVLIGGMAVHYVVAMPDDDEGGDPRQHPLDDPRRLASLVRPTADVDLVVPRERLEDVASYLAAAGFRPDPRRGRDPLRLEADGAWIDLLTRPADPPALLPLSAEAGEALAWLEAHRNPAGLWRGGLRLADPVSLVVLKALAWDQRRLARDLADIARLALWDRARGGATGAALGALADGLPPALHTPLARVRRAFTARGADSDGISDFVRVLRPELPELRADEDLEDDLRRLVLLATRALLDAWR